MTWKEHLRGQQSSAGSFELKEDACLKIDDLALLESVGVSLRTIGDRIVGIVAHRHSGED